MKTVLPAEPPVPSPAAANLNDLLAVAAEALSEALRAGRVEKARRPAARAALSQAFEAAAGETAVSLELVRLVDALAQSRPPFVLRGPRIGVPPLRGAVDRALVDRLVAYGEAAERISARIDAFLEATGAEPLRLFIAEVRPGDPDPPEMPFTQG